MCTFVEAAAADGGSGKELNRVKQQNKQLKEENNLLKIKIDLLLDMVSRTRHSFLPCDAMLARYILWPCVCHKSVFY